MLAYKTSGNLGLLTMSCLFFLAWHPCNKHCTFLHHNSVDWLCWCQTSRSKFSLVASYSPALCQAFNIVKEPYLSPLDLAPKLITHLLVRQTMLLTKYLWLNWKSWHPLLFSVSSTSLFMSIFFFLPQWCNKVYVRQRDSNW